MSNKNLREFSLFQSAVSVIEEVADLHYDEEKDSIVSVKIMHSVNLKSMQGIETFVNLLELNLSTNAIEKIEGLQNMSGLKVLNLSCNRIKQIQGLSALAKLERLALASNRITTLEPISQIGGEKYSLRYLDIKDNQLRRLEELKHLNCLVRLNELHVTLEDDPNPIFQDTAEYANVLANQPIAEQLQNIDGKPARVFFTQINQIEARINTQESRQGRQAAVTPVKSHGKEQSTYMLTTSKQSPMTSRSYIATDRDFNSGELLATELVQSQTSSSIYKEHTPKQHKTPIKNDSKLQVELLAVLDEKREYQDQNAQLINELNQRYLEVADLSNTISVLQSKKEKKDLVIEGLQARVGELMRENGCFHRELSLKNLELKRHADNFVQTSTRYLPRHDEQYDSPYSRPDTQRDNLNDAQAEIWNRYTELEQAYHERCCEVSDLESRNRDLIERIKELEDLSKRQPNQQDLLIDRRILDKEKEFSKKYAELKKKSKKDIKIQEEKFKETMNILENEFNSILLQNNNSLAELKASYEERCRGELELQELFNMQCLKTEELQQINQEHEIDIQSLLVEAEQLKKTNIRLEHEIAESRVIKLRRNESTPENGNQLLESKMTLLRVRGLEDELTARDRDLEKSRKHVQDLENQIELNNQTIRRLNTKLTKGSEAKESEERLKAELSNLREALGLKSRVLQEKDATIRELDLQLQKLRAEFSETNDQLNEYKKSHYESRLNRHKEIDYQRDLNDSLKSEVRSLKDTLRKAENTNKDLQDALDNTTKTLTNRENQLNSLEKNINQQRTTESQQYKQIKLLEDQIRTANIEIDRVIKTKDGEITDLHKQSERYELEMKGLVKEIETQKLIAQQNIDKLNQIFK